MIHYDDHRQTAIRAQRGPLLPSLTRTHCDRELGLKLDAKLDARCIRAPVRALALAVNCFPASGYDVMSRSLLPGKET
jgi:hypothetical protein